MLRASAVWTRTPVDLAAVVDDARDPKLAAGRALRAFTTALVRRLPDLDQRRSELVRAIGPQAAGQAAAVCGNFEMMNRILDATGVPVSRTARGLAHALGLPGPT